MPPPFCGGPATTDLERAATIGADVPFCVVGGRALVRGIGEVVEPLPFVAGELTLLTPPFGCSTAEVYRAWDRIGAGPHMELRGRRGTTSRRPRWTVQPQLATYRDALARADGADAALGRQRFDVVRRGSVSRGGPTRWCGRLPATVA